MTQLWLDSCGYNSTVDFLLATDCDVSQFDFPRNVEVLKITFESMKKKIQNIFDFEITLRLCRLIYTVVAQIITHRYEVSSRQRLMNG